jgi:putative alpha-1,2-mannosidase
VDSSPEFSRGGTLPIAALPFGMAHWTLQSDAGTPWMFHPRDRRIQGLRCTHQLSTWLGDYGYATFLPICGDVHPEAAKRASSYPPESAKLTPYSLQFFLLRYRAHVEMIPTERCGMLTAAFEKSEAAKAPGLVIDVPQGAFEKDEDSQTLRFTSTANKGGVPDNFATYYVLHFADRWERFEQKQSGSDLVGTVRFRPGQDVTVRIGTSFISYEQAERNLAQELGDAPAASLRAKAAAAWNDLLQRDRDRRGIGRTVEGVLFVHVPRASFSSDLARARWQWSDAALQRFQWKGDARRHVCRPRLLGCLSCLVSIDVYSSPRTIG